MDIKTLADLRANGYDVRITSNDYLPYEGTINNGSDFGVSFGNLDVVTSLEINNDSVNDDLTVNINNKSNFIVKGGESKTIDNTLINAIALSNSSGSNINYRLMLWGVSDV